MRFLITLILLFISLVTFSQGFRTRYYNTHSTDNSSRDIFEITQGSYIGTGFLIDTSQGVAVSKIALTGISNSGAKLWTKTYGTPQMEYLQNNFVQRTFYADGVNIYYAGVARKNNGTIFGVLIKFDSQGDTVWQRRYFDTTDDVIPQMVCRSIDGGFLITGFFQNWTIHYSRCMIIKTDSQGNELWRKKISKSSPDVQDGKAILQDSATKKIVITGYQYVPGPGGNYSHLDNILITDSLGNKIHQGSFHLGIGGLGADLIQTKDKKIVMVGQQFNPESVGGSPTAQSFAVKFDLNAPLIPIWRINHDKKATRNLFSSVVELKDGRLLLSGVIDTLQGVWNYTTTLPSNVLTRLTIIRNDSMIWNNYYDYKYNAPSVQNLQGIRSINLGKDGVWLGAIENFNYGVDPFLYVKYDTLGCDSSLNYCKGLLVQNDAIKSENADISLYPNPARNIISLRSNDITPQFNDCIYDIIDGAGRILLAGKVIEHRVDISSLESGFYTLIIRTQNQQKTTLKLIVEK